MAVVLGDKRRKAAVVVVRLKNPMSDGIFQGIPPFAPITSLRATPAIMAMGIIMGVALGRERD